MKIRIGKNLIRFAYKFVDIEASGETAILDDRMLEYSFVISRLVKYGFGNSIRILDVGCSARINPIPATMCELECNVWGIDIREFKYTHPNFKFALGDIRKTGFPNNFFDAVCAISSLEHIGIAGRYGIKESDIKGDLYAINEINRIIKPDGVFVATIPLVGKSSNLERSYTNLTITCLFDKWHVIERINYNNLVCIKAIKNAK
jgi:SAM-dependent methyltransferase